MEKLDFLGVRKYNKLNNKEQIVYNSFVYIVGNSLIPKMVHINGLIKLSKVKGFEFNYEQIKYITRKLVKKGFLERWTVQLGLQKHSYYRIKF